MFKAAEDSRRLTLPQKPEDLQFALPKDFQAPQGVEFKANENDPLLPQAKAFALKHGLSQDGFSELLALHAAGQIGTRQMIDNAVAAEVQKLGVNGTARKTAVDTFVSSITGVSVDDAKHFSEFMRSAKQVEVMERIIAHVRTQGVGSLSQSHREMPKVDSPPDTAWDKMSYAQQKAYAAQHDQTKVKAA